jgi:hypothetical protein
MVNLDADDVSGKILASLAHGDRGTVMKLREDGEGMRKRKEEARLD